MPTLTQQVTAAGDGRALHLVYEVSPARGARLVAVTATPPPATSALPPIELEGAQVEALAELNDLLPRIGSTVKPTHVQVVYGPFRSGGGHRRLALYWAMPEADAPALELDSRFATLGELFAHGGQLVGVEAEEPLDMPRLLGRRVSAGTYRALLLVSAQLGRGLTMARHPEPVAA